MQVERVRTLVALSMLLGACDSNQPDVKTEEVCRIAGGVWHSGSIVPPNRVLSWNVSVKGEDLVVNGVRKQIAELENELASARGYRPSPYLIMHKEAGTSCDRFYEVAKALDSAIDCKKNYCFYSSGAR